MSKNLPIQTLPGWGGVGGVGWGGVGVGWGWGKLDDSFSPRDGPVVSKNVSAQYRRRIIGRLQQSWFPIRRLMEAKNRP